jgi:hypothetical protein
MTARNCERIVSPNLTPEEQLVAAIEYIRGGLARGEPVSGAR